MVAARPARRRAVDEASAGDPARGAHDRLYQRPPAPSTRCGRVTEVNAVRPWCLAEGKTPPMASTKSWTGHSLGVLTACIEGESIR